MIHARNFAKAIPGATLTAVADPSREALEQAEHELGNLATFRDYNELLHSALVDAVVVVTPTNLHVGVVSEAAAAGKHILCEKPMAMTAGTCVDVSGTASVFAATTSELRPDTIDGMLGVGRSAVPGLWHPYAYVNGGGMNLEWFKTLAESLRGSKVSFDELNDMAAEAGSSDDHPVFVPHLAGRMSPSDPGMRGAWVGLVWNHSAGVLYRSILESIALEYQLYKERLLQINPDQTVLELRNTGGGNTSALWRQLKADTMNVRVVEIPDFAGATHGVAMVAAVGAGMYDSVEEIARQWVKTGSATEPSAQDRTQVERRLQRYRDALAMMQGYAG